MFTAEEVKNAINRIFKRFPIEEMEDLQEMSSDIAEVLKPDLLSRWFRNSASVVYHFLKLSAMKSIIPWQGIVCLTRRQCVSVHSAINCSSLAPI